MRTGLLLRGGSTHPRRCYGGDLRCRLDTAVPEEPELSPPGSRLPVMTETVVETVVESSIVGSLSPSRAADFKTCPLLYRFRCIDRLPEAPSRRRHPRARSSTRCWSRCSTCPPAQRTLDAARALLEPPGSGCWPRQPELDELFADDGDGAEFAEWLAIRRRSRRQLLRLGGSVPARARSARAAGRGRRRRAAAARLRRPARRVARPATCGSSTTRPAAIPREAFEAKALFQMKFYALVLWRTRGVVPRQLRLMYLADTRHAQLRTRRPRSSARFERTVQAIWAAIERALRRASSGRARAGCATGATTRRCARRSAAPRRRFRPTRCNGCTVIGARTHPAGDKPGTVTPSGLADGGTRPAQLPPRFAASSTR